MASAKPKLSDQGQVTQHIQKLEPVLTKTIQFLREIILSTWKKRQKEVVT
jgi:hypothetical protein